MYRILHLIPKNHLSYIVGLFAEIHFPKLVSTWMIKFYARIYGINKSELKKPLEAYTCLAEFFTRELKDGVRPIGDGFVSPVDGCLRSFGTIQDGQLLQVKGLNYSLDDFILDREVVEQFKDGFYFNFYLSPQDYHHIHAPLSGQITKARHIPGKLWPVNDWSINSINNLFAVNERLISYIESECGLVLVVMVGATNVGKISVVYDDIVTNSFKARCPKDYVEDYVISKGEKLGTFHLGSSVVVLFEKNRVQPVEGLEEKIGQKLCCGESLGILPQLLAGRPKALS